MKKKIIATIMAVLFLSLSFNVNTTYAATCPPHSNFQDVVQYYSFSSYTHQVKTNLQVGGVPITQDCTVYIEAKTHFLLCGVCRTKVGYYPENNISHSIKHP